MPVPISPWTSARVQAELASGPRGSRPLKSKLSSQSSYSSVSGKTSVFLGVVKRILTSKHSAAGKAVTAYPARVPLSVGNATFSATWLKWPDDENSEACLCVSSCAVKDGKAVVFRHDTGEDEEFYSTKIISRKVSTYCCSCSCQCTGSKLGHIVVAKADIADVRDSKRLQICEE